MKIRILISAALLACTVSFAQNPAQWRGPERDGHYPGTGLMKAWPAAGPALAWSQKGIGTGYSTAVSDGRQVYITGMKDTTDYLTALDLNGAVKWQVPFGPAWNGPFPDTRCTPTVEDGCIYVVSGLGTLSSIRTSDGKTNWRYDAYTRFGGACGTWGVCESLLIDGDHLIYSPAGPKTTLVALDKRTGEPVWQTETLHDTSAYVSPLLIRHGGKKIIVTILSDYLVGVDASGGKILWRYNYGAFEPEEGVKIWPGAPKTNAITPLYHDGMLFITGGYDHPAIMFKLSPAGDSIQMVWSSPVLDCHHGGVILQDSCIYGANWLDNSRGNWCCLGWKGGKTLYETKWMTKGSIIGCDGMLYIYDEKNGNVGLLKPDPARFELAGTFKVPEGKGPCWSHPSIFDGILYVRRGDVLMAYDIKQH